jgi:hypothetical protein
MKTDRTTLNQTTGSAPWSQAPACVSCCCFFYLHEFQPEPPLVAPLPHLLSKLQELRLLTVPIARLRYIFT